LLDFGCGTGEIARALAAQGWKVIGCDVSLAMVEIARSAKDGNSVEWVALEAGEKLPFSAAKFDVVIASSVFEYLGDPPSVLGELARVLAPGGGLFATVPDMRHPYRKAEDVRRRLLRIAPLRLFLQFTRWRDVASYLRFSVNRYSVEEWCALLKGANLHAEFVPPGENTLLLLEAKKREPVE
jgi:ubiquinone/menaquinone biosynthesis C-methylase UbiE